LRKYLVFIGLLSLAWLSIFFLNRLLFIVYYYEKWSASRGIETIKSLLYGLKLDISLMAYLLIIAVLLLGFNLFFNIKNGHKRLSIFCLGVILLLTIIDIGLYEAWNFRLDATFLTYLSNPKEMIASTGGTPVFTLFLIWCVAFYGYEKILQQVYLFFPSQKSMPISKKMTYVFFLLSLSACFVIPLRGGFGQIPINQSSVYFSTQQFANHAAVNPVWSFFDSIINKNNVSKSQFDYFAAEEAKHLLDQIVVQKDSFEMILKKNKTKTNVIILVWESLSSKLVASAGGKIRATPALDSLVKKGIFFPNAYASGDRTDKGIVAILSGFPAQPLTSILKEPKKAERLPILSKDFKRNGYHTAFYYGGEIDFAGLKSYIYNGDFEKIITKDDFPQTALSSKWGAFDHIVFERFYRDVQQAKSPFFYTLLSLSSHEPFEVPADWTQHHEFSKGDTPAARFANVHFYTDAAFGQLVAKMEKLPIWENTVLVVVGDHGSRLIETVNDDEHFKTPILLLGGALNQQGKVNEKVFSQLDIAKTLLEQNGINADAYLFSRNLFAKKAKHFAQTSFNNGFGCFDDDCKIIYDNQARKIVFSKGDTTQLIPYGKAFQQMTIDAYFRQ
jgi:phosphoglycerol transferase MdoB-like AlkP superfamily enzyme